MQGDEGRRVQVISREKRVLHHPWAEQDLHPKSCGIFGVLQKHKTNKNPVGMFAVQLLDHKTMLPYVQHNNATLHTAVNKYSISRVCVPKEQHAY